MGWGSSPSQAVCAPHFINVLFLLSPSMCCAGCSGVTRHARTHTKPLRGTAGMMLVPFPNRDQRKHGLGSREDSAFVLHLLIYCDTVMKPWKKQILREQTHLQPLYPSCLQLTTASGF